MSVGDQLHNGKANIDVWDLTVNGVATGNFPSSSVVGLTNYIVDQDPALGILETKVRRHAGRSTNSASRLSHDAVGHSQKLESSKKVLCRRRS